MNTQRFIQLSGYALALNGLLFAVAKLFHPDDAHAQALVQSTWIPVHLAAAAAFGLGVIGLVGLHWRQLEQSGKLGLWAFALSLLGATIASGVTIIEVAVLPAVAAAAGGDQSLLRFLGNASPLPGILPIFLATILLFEIGYILTGVAIMRAGVFPKVTGLLLIAGVVLDLVPLLVVKMAAGLLFGVATIWIGVLLIGYGKTTTQSANTWATAR